MGKKALCLIFAFLLSINSFAAVVSDNDGSAFITKAEFDSLKSNFQSQIDSYNIAIDSKIDYAVASYLAGIKLEQPPTNLWAAYVAATGQAPLIAKSFSIGNGSVTPSKNVTTKLTMVANVINNLEFHMATMRQPACYVTTPGYGATVNFHAAVICGSPTNYDPSTGYNGRNISQVYSHNAKHNNWSVPVFSPSLYYNSSNGKESYAIKKTNKTRTVHTDGSGAAWVYQNINGVPCLKYYCTELYPEYDVNIVNSKFKTYTLNSTNYFNSTGKSINSSSAGWTQQSVDAKIGELIEKGDKSEASSSSQTKNYASVETSIIRTTDGYNYLNTIWALKSNSSIYCYNEDYQGSSGSSYTTINGEDVEWYDEYFGGVGADRQVNTLAKSSAKVKYLSFAPQSINFKNFGNYTLSSIANTNVYHGNGIPLAKINDSDKEYNLKINVQNNNNPTIELKVSNQPFNLGSFVLGAKQYVNQDITKGEHTFKIKIDDKDTLLWVWVYNKSDNTNLTINNFDLEIINS